MSRVLVLVSLVLLPIIDAPAGGGALVNGQIHTMYPDAPHVHAMAWDGQGRIVYLGDNDGLKAGYPHLEAFDEGGKTVLPGLIDAHDHVMGLGLANLQADLIYADSLEAAIETLTAQAETLPAGAWLTGRGWGQKRWKGQGFPRALDLDEVFPNRPLWLVRVDGHASWANSAALDREAKDLSGDCQPQGGAIHRSDEGQPTGILIGTAMRFVEDAMPTPGGEVRARALELALEEMARYGLTSVHYMGASLQDFQLFSRLEEFGELSVHITAFADGDEATLDWLCENGSHEGERLKARSVNFYADGALGNRGAALLADYSDHPGNNGLLFKSDDEMQQLVDRAMACGLQLGIHAAVTRQRDDPPPGGWRAHEALSLEQALRGFTIDAAHAGFAEGEVGSRVQAAWKANLIRARMHDWR